MLARFRIVLALGLVFCLAAMPRAAFAEWVTLTFADAAFTALFPVEPEYSSEWMGASEVVPEPYLMHTYVSQDATGDFVFLVAHTDYPASYSFAPYAELKANQNNFNNGIQARLLTSRETTYQRGPGDVLPAIEFMSESESMNREFKGIIIADGQRIYMAVAGNRKGLDAAAETDRLISSFRLLPR